MISTSLLSTLLLGAALVHGAALTGLDRRGPACTADACGNSFSRALGYARQREAQSFCESYVTDGTEATTTATTTTTIDRIVTVTASSTVTETYYPCAVPLKKRGDTRSTPGWAQTACQPTGTVRAEERLSSACSCMGISGKPTATVTAYETTSTTADWTTTVTPTTTVTYSDPYKPKPTNLVSNGGFEDGSTGWTFKTYSKYTKVELASPGRNSNSMVRVNMTSPGVPEGHYGPDYRAYVYLEHAVPVARPNYYYSLRFDYKFLERSRGINYCNMDIWVGKRQIAYEYPIENFPEDGWDDAGASYEFNTTVAGPLTIRFECMWVLEERENDLKASLQIDNVSWMATDGCWE